MRSSKQSFESRIVVIALVAAAFAPVVATSQVVAPVPIEAEQPELPPGPSGIAPEGWVVVRYSVLADGTTANVRVIDKMPATLVDRPILVGVERWRFEPATSGGDAVDWHNNEAVIVFDQEMVPPEPRAPAIRRRVPGGRDAAPGRRERGRVAAEPSTRRDRGQPPDGIRRGPGSECQGQHVARQRA